VTTRDRDWDAQETEALGPLEGDLAKLRERHHDDPPIDLLRAGRAEALPEPLQERANAQLASSTWSRTLVDGADEADASLDAAAADRLLARVQQDATRTAPAEPRRRWTWTPAVAVGALAAAALVIVIVWRPAPAPVTTNAERPATTAPAPQTRVFKLPLDKPDVILRPTALVVRGEGNSGRFVDEAAPGLNAYRAGNYEQAARELDAIRPRYPNAVEIPFYIGISRLFLSDATAAVRALESARAMNDASFADEIAWYLAVAYERADTIDRSRALLDGLCRGNGPSAARACAAASSLQ
jgi:hypothetical protein